MKAHVLRLQGKDCLSELKRAAAVDRNLTDVLVEYLLQRGKDVNTPLADIKSEQLKNKILIKVGSIQVDEQEF